MAASRPVTRSMDENAIQLRAGKVLQQKPQGTKRRALGDIGNTLRPSSNTRGQAAKAKVEEQPPKPRAPSRGRGRRSSGAAPATALAAADKQEPGLDPPVRVTRARAKSLAGQGVSLSSLLSSRSEAVHKPKRKKPSAPALPDIDGIDKDNPLAECTYVNDIHLYYRRVEPKFRVPSDYMNSQVDINEKMRAILIDWLVEVHLKFKLLPETLFLTCNLIDRYLAVAKVTRRRLQLVGVTAMLIAAKYEEIWAPEVRDFVYISDRAYERSDILDMEKQMLKALDYNLTLPTSYQYLARLLKAATVHYEKPLTLFVAFCAELCLVDYRMLKYSYSEQAAAIMYVAMRAFNKEDPYPHPLMRHAFQTKESILHVAKEVINVVCDAHTSNLQAVVKKYSTTKFMEAAKVEPPMAILQES